MDFLDFIPQISKLSIFPTLIEDGVVSLFQVYCLYTQK